MNNRQMVDNSNLLQQVIEGTRLSITDYEGDIFTLTCVLHAGKWELYDDKGLKYGCNADSLQELRDLILSDWKNNLISDILIHNSLVGDCND